MAQEIINIGAAANDGTGDPLRTAFDKVNNNFTQLYTTLSASGPDGAIQFKNTNTLYSTLYVGGTYLIAGAPGRIYYSNNGSVWSPANTGTEAGLYSLAYDGIDTIIAVGASGTILRSTDGGVTWASATSGVTENLYGAVGYDGNFAVVGANGTILTSSVGGEGYTTIPTVTIAAPANAGGITATATATIANGRVSGFTITEPGLGYNTSPTVTIANPNTPGITATATAEVGGGIVTAVNLTSGITWNEPVTGITNTLTGITHGNLNISAVATPIYVATGVTGTIVTSTDLVTWSSVSTGESNDLYSAVIDPLISKLIVVGDNGTVLTTFNASLWTNETSNVSTTLTSIAFGVVDTITDLIAVGDVGTVIRSNNGGVNWYTAASNTTGNALLGVTFVSNTANITSSSFIAVGSNATVIESNALALANAWSLQSVGSALQGDANLLYFPGTQTLSANANIVPGTDSAFSLGSPNLKFTDLYLAGNSLYLGTTLITSNANNSITFAQASNTANLTDLIGNSITVEGAEITGNINVGDYVLANNVTTGNLIAANANFTTLTVSNIQLNGNITADYFFGNGAFLTGISGNGGSFPAGNSGAVQINYLGNFSNQGGTLNDTYSTFQFDGNGMPTIDGTNAYQQRVNYSPYLQILSPRVESEDFGIVAGPGITIVGYDDNYNTPRSAYFSVQNRSNVTQQWDFGILGNGDNNYSISDRTNGNIWSFGTDGNITLPSNTSSINYANGDPYSGGVSTGNVTFDDQIVIGTGSDDGSGGLYLATGPTGAANLQYLQVRGGDNVAHIHLDTGNNAYYDQYFGDDNKYLKLEAGITGNVVIGTDDDTGNLYSWAFGSDSNLTVPGGILGAGNLKLSPDSANAESYLDIFLTSGPDLHLDASANANLILGKDNYANVLVSWDGNVYVQSWSLDTGNVGGIWTFSGDGSTIFPTLTVDIHNGGNQSAQTLQFGDPNQQAIITGPTPEANVNAQRLIIQGQRGNGEFSEGGDVYVWGGDSETNGGDIKIYAGDADNASAGSGGYINLAGGDGFDNGGDVTLRGGYGANGPGGNIRITGGFSGNGTGSYGNVVLGSASGEWTFDNTSNLTVPGGMKINGNINVFGTDTALIQPTDDLPLSLVSSGANASTTTIWVEDINDIANSAIAGLYAPLSGTANVRIVTGNNANIVNFWDFGSDGNLSLPTGGTLIVSGGIIGSGASPAPTLSGFSSVSALSFTNGNSNVTINANSRSWIFDSTGNLSLPGNINMNGNWVGNIGYAVANTDAASKQYVDTLVSTGISYHQPVNAASTTTLAVATTGTTAYNEPNGSGNGIGAYISTTGSFTTIDGVTINGSTSIRILVKDEANAAWNGVYNYTNATAITRTTDTDEYGIGSPLTLSINDYFFTQAGSVNAGAAFIVSAPNGTITFGTSNITFSTFSTSQVYTASTGINIAGTVISANASQTQITAVGTLGSLAVSGNANVTGDVIGGNLVTTGQITSTRAGNASTGAGQLYLNGSGNNRIDFNINGTGAPTFTARSAGAKVVLYPLLSGSQGDYALGIDSGTLWTSLPAADSGLSFKWYGGTTEIANLSGTGVFQVAGNANVGNLGTATAIITTGNITTVNTGLVQNGNSNVAITANANITLTSRSNAVMVITGTGANITGTGNFSGNVSAANFVGNLIGAFANGNSNVNIPAANGNVNISAIGNANILVITGTGANITGTANVSGNANVGNLGTNIANITTANVTTAIISTGNITTINSGLLQNGNSNVTITANANVTITSKSNATMVITDTGANITGTANVSGNANVGNLGTTTAIITTGNITTVNTGLVQNGNSNVTITANANVTITSNSNATMVISDTGVNVTGNITAIAATATASSTAASVGYLGMPQQSKSSAYTTVIGDAGKHIYVTATATMTIDSNANVAYPIGTAIVFISSGGTSTTIAINSDTMYLAGTGTTGSRTLAAYGMATAIKVNTTVWFISGTGLT